MWKTWENLQVFYCSLPNSSLSNVGSVNKIMATSWLGNQREAGPTLKLRSWPALTVNYFQVMYTICIPNNTESIFFRSIKPHQASLCVATRCMDVHWQWRGSKKRCTFFCTMVCDCAQTLFRHWYADWKSYSTLSLIWSQ